MPASSHGLHLTGPPLATRSLTTVAYCFLEYQKRK